MNRRKLEVCHESEVYGVSQCEAVCESSSILVLLGEWEERRPGCVRCGQHVWSLVAARQRVPVSVVEERVVAVTPREFLQQ